MKLGPTIAKRRIGANTGIGKFARHLVDKFGTERSRSVVTATAVIRKVIMEKTWGDDQKKGGIGPVTERMRLYMDAFKEFSKDWTPEELFGETWKATKRKHINKRKEK